MSSTASTASIAPTVPVPVVPVARPRRALSDIRRGDVFQDVNPFAHLDAQRRLIQGTPVQIG